MPGASAGTEPWFALDYGEAPVAAQTLQQWAEAQPASELTLPQPNAFIASDFELVVDHLDPDDRHVPKANGAAAANGSPTQARLCSWQSSLLSVCPCFACP